MNPHPPATTFQHLFVGLDAQVPNLFGKHQKYINFDNAASTPSLHAVQRAVNNFLPYYSSVHRGAGFKSQLSTQAYDRARQITLEFMGGNPKSHVCIFGKNSTEALNKLAHRFPFTRQRNMVITTAMEHHSDDLPWRAVAEVVHVRLLPNGQLDEADFDAQLNRYADQVALVAVSGASNVTGYLNPIHRLAEKTHAVGAQFVADCAQLAPHRKIEMGALDDPEHLDYVVLSAHKMYAPFGTGALIGRRDTFEQGDPDMRGGGTVQMVTLDDVRWASSPDRDEAGSPNVIGAVALAAAIQQLQTIGMDAVAAHEAELTTYALPRLKKIPGIQLFGDTNPANAAQRVGVIPFNLQGMSHFLVAAVLGHEFGIGVRNGCFCAHPYILYLLGVSPEEATRVRQNMINGDKREMPGLVRISFGLYNTIGEIDVLVDALQRISHGEAKGTYTQDKPSGEFHPMNWQPDFSDYFSLE